MASSRSRVLGACTCTCYRVVAGVEIKQQSRAAPLPLSARELRGMGCGIDCFARDRGRASAVPIALQVTLPCLLGCVRAASGRVRRRFACACA